MCVPSGVSTNSSTRIHPRHFRATCRCPPPPFPATSHALPTPLVVRQNQTLSQRPQRRPYFYTISSFLASKPHNEHMSSALALDFNNRYR